MRSSRKRFLRSIVADDIQILIQEAEKDPPRAKTYLKMAWELVKRNKVRLTKEQKKKFCKRCFSLWIPEETVKIEKKGNLVEYSCKCGFKKKIGS